MLRAARDAGRMVPALLGFADDAAVDQSLLASFGPHLGDLSQVLTRHPGVPLLGGIGSGRLRQRLLDSHPAPAPLIHPMADVGPDNVLGLGTVVCSHVSLTTNVTCGRHVHISRGAAIGHDVILGDYVSIMPLASVSGGVHLAEGVFVGTGALIRQGVHVGRNAVIGMGAVVLADVPDGMTVVGNPARPQGTGGGAGDTVADFGD